MAVTKEYKNYVLDQLSLLNNITCRPMMGGYLIYYNDVLIGGLYGGDRFLLKIVDGNKKYNLTEEKPYDSAKRMMYLIENIEDKDLLKNIVIDTYDSLRAMGEEK